MTISPTYTVFCDGCIAWVAQQPSIKSARAEARYAHWKRPMRDGRRVDLCPVCAGVPCQFGNFHECLVHGSYALDGSAVCKAILDRQGQATDG